MGPIWVILGQQSNLRPSELIIFCVKMFFLEIIKIGMNKCGKNTGRSMCWNLASQTTSGKKAK